MVIYLLLFRLYRFLVIWILNIYLFFNIKVYVCFCRVNWYIDSLVIKYNVILIVKFSLFNYFLNDWIIYFRKFSFVTLIL